MTDRPIIFSAPMVKALIRGDKTQTRRILKPARDLDPATIEVDGETVQAICRTTGCFADVKIRFAAGDRLWVRENWRPVGDGPLSECVGPEDVAFAASFTDQDRAIFNWRPSIHMPRWASRLTLAVTGVKVERLQNISEADAQAEGCVEDDGDTPGIWYVPGARLPRHGATAKECFGELWKLINGAEAWDSNPWVVAVSFDVHKCNIDRMEKAA